MNINVTSPVLNTATRDTLVKATCVNVALDSYGGTCGAAPAGIISLPCGNSETSGLVNILEEKNKGDFPSGYPEMPAGGPYFPEEQIKSLAAWVDADCPK